MAPPLPLILLLMIQGVYSADVWIVNYSHSYICALKDSSVIINCTYKYPPGHQIDKVFWTKINSEDPPDLSEDSEYRQRIQYLGDKQHDCSIRLTDVRHTDSHKYYFRFITNVTGGKWTGKPGVTLDITDLQVESAETVTEGHSVTLTCKSRCSLTDRATFIWIKNTQSLRERTDRKNQLILQSVRREDAGSYSCAVQGHSLTSPAVYLNVIYAPDKPVISTKPVKIVEGDSVTLTCSSEANPPAEISWFKETHYIGSGSSYNISKISSDHSEEYKCKSSNKHGEKYSDTVTLNVLYPPKNVSASISESGEIVEGDSVTLTCSSESNPPVQNYTWFKENETSAVGSGQTYSITNINSSHSGRFYCEAQNEVGSQRSAAVSVTVKGGSGSGLYVVAGVTGGCVFIIIVIIVFVWKCKHRTDDIRDNQFESNNILTADDHMCSTITQRVSESRDTEEIQYATVQHLRVMKTSEGFENDYENYTVQHDAAERSAVKIKEDSSMIYSTVK